VGAFEFQETANSASAASSACLRNDTVSGGNMSTTIATIPAVTGTAGFLQLVPRATQTANNEPSTLTVNGWISTPTGVANQVEQLVQIGVGTWTLTGTWTASLVTTGAFQVAISAWQTNAAAGSGTNIPLTGADANHWVLSAIITPGTGTTGTFSITINSVAAVTFAGATPCLWVELGCNVTTKGTTASNITLSAVSLTVPAITIPVSGAVSGVGTVANGKLVLLTPKAVSGVGTVALQRLVVPMPKAVSSVGMPVARKQVGLSRAVSGVGAASASRLVLAGRTGAVSGVGTVALQRTMAPSPKGVSGVGLLAMQRLILTGKTVTGTGSAAITKTVLLQPKQVSAVGTVAAVRLLRAQRSGAVNGVGTAAMARAFIGVRAFQVVSVGTLAVALQLTQAELNRLAGGSTTIITPIFVFDE
jgi:hypothetical protein